MKKVLGNVLKEILKEAGRVALELAITAAAAMALKKLNEKSKTIGYKEAAVVLDSTETTKK